ncbi:hypothetical protein Alches_25350 [Alicyclobacillus hesperidum subsp. aegles]|nr:hypothetical protein Alches_25350 [Alicyclobacillus hesperidum subsp. aegles]
MTRASSTIFMTKLRIIPFMDITGAPSDRTIFSNVKNSITNGELIIITTTYSFVNLKESGVAPRP